MVHNNMQVIIMGYFQHSMVIRCPRLQGHSTTSTLPPLPEDGPTYETEVTVDAKGGDESPLPSATASPSEEAEEDGVEGTGQGACRD